MADKLEVKYTNEKYLKLLPWKIMYRSERSTIYRVNSMGTLIKLLFYKCKQSLKGKMLRKFMAAGLTKKHQTLHLLTFMANANTGQVSFLLFHRTDQLKR